MTENLVVRIVYDKLKQIIPSVTFIPTVNILDSCQQPCLVLVRLILLIASSFLYTKCITDDRLVKSTLNLVNLIKQQFDVTDLRNKDANVLVDIDLLWLHVNVIFCCVMNQSSHKLCSTRVILKLEAFWDALYFDSKLRALVCCKMSQLTDIWCCQGFLSLNLVKNDSQVQIRSDLVEPLVTSMASVIAPLIILARDDLVFPHCFKLLLQRRL